MANAQLEELVSLLRSETREGPLIQPNGEKETTGRRYRLFLEDPPCIFLFELPIIDAFSPQLVGYVPRPDAFRT